MRRNRLSTLSETHEELQINLTPLIDVVFVVLIAFVVIAPMLELDHIQLAPGISKENRDLSSLQEPSALSIHVREDNTIWLNQKLVSSQELLLILKQAHLHTPTRIPQLFHDKKAHFGTYQTVKNAVELAGFEQMDVILQPG
jgi:biopolymer transport protein ExbD